MKVCHLTSVHDPLTDISFPQPGILVSPNWFQNKGIEIPSLPSMKHFTRHLDKSQSRRDNDSTEIGNHIKPNFASFNDDYQLKEDLSQRNMAAHSYFSYENPYYGLNLFHQKPTVDHQFNLNLNQIIKDCQVSGIPSGRSTGSRFGELGSVNQHSHASKSHEIPDFEQEGSLSPTDMGDCNQSPFHAVYHYSQQENTLLPSTPRLQHIHELELRAQQRNNESDVDLKTDVGELIDQDETGISSDEISPRSEGSSEELPEVDMTLPKSFFEGSYTVNYSKNRRRKYRKRYKNRDPFSAITERIDPGDHGGIRVKYDNEVTFVTIKSINWKQYRPKRAGVIPYVIEEDGIYFCLGRDMKTDDLTDFGGHIDSSDNSALSGGLREFDEETHGIFGQINIKQILSKKVACRNDMMIIFIPVNINRDLAQKKFTLAAELSDDREIKGIIWLHEDDLIKLMREGQLKINQTSYNLYYEVHEFISQLICHQPMFIKRL